MPLADMQKPAADKQKQCAKLKSLWQANTFQWFRGSDQSCKGPCHADADGGLGDGRHEKPASNQTLLFSPARRHELSVQKIDNC